VKGEDVDVIEIGECADRGSDLSDSRKEDEDIPGVVLERMTHCCGDTVL
jgi:hypothetical protein